MKLLAIDIGGTSIKSALFENNRAHRFSEIPSDAKSGASFLLNKLYHLIEQHSGYDAIGVSTAGQVDNVGGSILFANENIPGYTGTPLKKLLNDRFGVPVFVENDVNAAALGEGVFGAARDEKDFLCLTYGTGVGGAIVIQRRIYRGSSLVAGEFGHLIIHGGGLLCACGQKGCYEQYASTTALIRSAQAVNPSFSNGRILFESLASGNETARQAVDRWIEEVLHGLAGLVHIFNPSCIVLGGGIMNEDYILQEIGRLLPGRIMKSYQKVQVKKAQLGNHAGLYGMVAIAGTEMPGTLE